MALRIISLPCGLLLAAGLSSGGALAAGQGGGFMAAPSRPGIVPAHRPQLPGRIGGYRHGFGGTSESGYRRGGVRRWAWGGAGYPGPWLFYPPGDNRTVAVIARSSVDARPADPDSFENLTARAGIRRGPTPEPTIYRLEGPRLAPAARVIRVGGADAGATRRTRFAHAETGALLLTVPGR